MSRVVRSDPREEAETDRATSSCAPHSPIHSLAQTQYIPTTMTHARENRLHDASNFDDFMLAAVSAMLIAAILVV